MGPPLLRRGWKEAPRGIVGFASCGLLYSEPAARCSAACDDFARKEGNLLPARHAGAAQPAFGSAPLPCAPRTRLVLFHPAVLLGPTSRPRTPFPGQLSPSRNRPSSAAVPRKGGFRIKMRLCLYGPMRSVRTERWMWGWVHGSFFRALGLAEPRSAGEGEIGRAHV